MLKQRSLISGLAICLATATIYPAHSQGYYTFVDPKEHAFSLEVPKEWHAQGGLYRFSSTSSEPVVQLASPNGERIFIGDPNIRPFTANGPISGLQFAEQWGGRALQRMCGGQIALRQAAPVQVGIQNASSGEALFSCGENSAYVFATIKRIPGPAPMFEVPDAIIGIAASSDINSIMHIIQHLRQTAQINQQWYQAQQRNYGAAIDSAGQMTNNLMEQQRRNSINTPGSTNYNIDQAVRGYTTTPGGNEVQIQGSGNYYWNCGGRQVNTQSYMAPSPSCRPIQ